VKAGDTLYGLAARYLSRPADAEVVRQLNHVSNPRRLPIGRTLTVPSRLLRTEPIAARLTAYSGTIAVRASGALTPRLEMPLQEGYELETGRNAFLTFELPDASRVTLPSQSRVRLERLRKVLLTGAVQRDIRVEDGRASSTVTPMPDKASRFRILTPVAVSAVRGTEFRVKHDAAAGRSTLEVLEGHVAQATARGPQETAVPAGFAVATAAAGVSPPVKLLPPPALEAPARLQDDPVVGFRLRPEQQAAAYHAEIARDAGFIDVIAEATAASPEIALANIPNGTLFVRLTQIDAAGFEGLPATYAFERRLNALGLAPPTAVPGARREYLFKWRSTGGAPEVFRFRLTRDGAEGEPVIDAPGLTERRIIVSNLPPGLYFWRVLVTRREGGRVYERWSAPERFEIGR
jgi:hypothetical protein